MVMRAISHALWRGLKCHHQPVVGSSSRLQQHPAQLIGQASCLPGSSGYGTLLAGPTPCLRRCWLPGPWGATHSSFSGRAGKISRASCMLWKSLVPRLSLLCRSIRFTSSFTPQSSKYHISSVFFRCKFFIWLLANESNNKLESTGP